MKEPGAPWPRRSTTVDLRAGDAVVDVSFERHDGQVGVKVRRKHGDVEVPVVL
jgi:hypothetical protein